METLYQLSYGPDGVVDDTSGAPPDPARAPTRRVATLVDHERERSHGRRPAAVPVRRPAGQRDRDALAGSVGGRPHLLGPQPRRPAGRGVGAGGRQAEALRPRHVPVPERRRAPCGPPARLHRHRRLRPLLADAGPQRPPRDGLRRLRSPRRAVRGADRPAPPGDHRGQRRQHAPPAPGAGPRSRSPSRGRHHRRRLLPLDAVDLPPDLRLLVRRRRRPRPSDRRARRSARGRNPGAGERGQPRRPPVVRPRRAHAPGRGRLVPPRVPRGGDGQLVPGARHRPRQRGGHRRRPQRARQPPGVPPSAEAVGARHHFVRRPAPRRPRPRRLARAR